MLDDSRIRERAHQIWEQTGRPDGQHENHWAQAELELASEGSRASAMPSSADGQAADGGAQVSDGADGAASPTINAPDAGGASPGEAVVAAKALNEASRGAGGKARRR